MLVLSRRKGEKIIIGDTVIIEVIDIRGDKCRFGIQAPTDVPIHREEVYNKIQGQNSASAGTTE